MDPGRKLTVGETLSEVFALYQEHFGVLIPTAFWLFLVVAILNGIAGTSSLLGLVAIVALAVGILYQGMVVNLVRDVQDGRRDSSVGDLVRSVGPVFGTLIGASILAGIGEAVGFFLLIVPGCILLTIWAVIAPVIVVEKTGVFAAFRRSQELVRDYGWPVFGSVIAATLIALVATLVLGSIGDAIAGGPLLRIVFSALASTITAPITALVAAVLYYRLLALKDGTSPNFDAMMPPPLDPDA
jgi:MFS family permease